MIRSLLRFLFPLDPAEYPEQPLTQKQVIERQNDYHRFVHTGYVYPSCTSTAAIYPAYYSRLTDLEDSR